MFALIETKLRDATELRALADAEATRCGIPMRFLSCCRPDAFNADGDLNDPSGGILVVVLNPRLAISDVWTDSKGLLSFSAKLPGVRRFACVCCYLPDAASPYARWNDDLVESAASEIRRRRQGHGDLVFWLGDFNTRLGNDHLGRRRTPDVRGVTTPRVRRLRRALRLLGMLPVHGRADHLPADFTSKSIIPGRAGLAEVDYIIAPTSLPASMFQRIDAPSWGSDELSAHGTHVPLMVEVDVGAEPMDAPQRDKPRRKPFILPPYCDRRWFTIHSRIERGIPRVLRAVNHPGATPESSYATLTDLFRSAAVSVCGTAIARTQTFRHRLYHKAPLPSELVSLFQLARSLRSRGNDARGSAKVALKRQADRVKANATRLADAFLRRFRDQVLTNLQREMRIDPHSVHTYLRHLRGAEVTNADRRDIPSGPDGVPPIQRFPSNHRNLVTQTGALPAALSQAQWTQLVFRAVGGVELVRLFSARELYPYFFPPTKRFRFQPCHAACSICRQYAVELDQWRPRDPFPQMGVPHHRGTLHTSRGAGLDGITAELIRWVRPEDFADRFDYRMAVCNLLAGFFNQWLSSRSVPDGDFADCVTTPLLKTVKPGQPVPPLWDPDSYRFITSSSLFAKAFSTVLASRLAHWAVRTGLLSVEQVAFLPFRGTEEHVFTAQQVLRQRARQRQLSFLLFADFQKAYDSVHLDALWAVLDLQGVPAEFIDLLRDWAGKRRTRVRVNGELSEAYPMSKGVPQGDPLSCLLFDLYIDSLSRFLRSRPDLSGVSAFGGGISVQHLLYADDLLGFADSAAELQRLLNYVKQWADAWGLALNTGAGKTEAMCVDVRAPNGAWAAMQPLQLDDGRLVRWTTQYRYLGYHLRCDLSDEGAVAFLFSHLDYLWNAHFVHNGLVRHASAAFQMQYYSTMVQGSLRHLRALTTIGAVDSARLEAKLRGHVRDIFDMRISTPVEMVSAMGAMLPWHAVHAQEHERLYLQLRESRYPQSIAARVFRLAQADPQLGASGATRNWVRMWEKQRTALAAHGIPLPRPGLAYHLVPIAASKFGRAVAFIKWQASGRARSGPALAAQPCYAGDAPSQRPIDAVADLYERFSAPLSSLGDHRAFTPLSTHGPGCSGSVPARTNVAARRLGPIMWARTGAAAMSTRLFNFGRLDHSARATQCPLCRGTAPLDFYHLAVECVHPVIDAWRARCEAAARRFLPTLLRLLARERDRAGCEPEDRLFDRACRAMRRLDLDSSQGDFIVYRFLIAHPWSETMARPHMRCVRLVGRIFDLPGVYHRFERPALDLWCRWSVRWIWQLSHAWREAIRA